MTSYHLAVSETEISQCADFLGVRKESFLWPVIMAENDGIIVGVLGTQNREDCIVAGPLSVDSDNNGPVMIKLIETYDKYLKKVGIETYMFFVDYDNNDWINQVERSGTVIMIEDMGSHKWYRRDLNGRQH